MTGLKWCPGCQANVRPKPFNECPRCGSTVKPTEPISPKPQGGIGIDEIEIETVPERDIELEFEVELEEEMEIEAEKELDIFESEPVQTPVNPSRLVLNPKVKDGGINPLCPDCEEPVERLVGGSDDYQIVEFRCGCDELRRFEFGEVDGE